MTNAQPLGDLPEDVRLAILTATKQSQADFAQGKVARLTMHPQFHWQLQGDPVVTAGKPGHMILETLEQPYGPRRLVIGPTATPLDLGWVAQPGIIYIENSTGMNQFVNPTADQVANLAKQVCQVLVGDLPVSLLPPGLGLPYNFPDPRAVKLRNLGSDNLRIQITVFPA